MNKIGQNDFLTRLGILQRDATREAWLAIGDDSFSSPRRQFFV
jgi:hypothetical protein